MKKTSIYLLCIIALLTGLVIFKIPMERNTPKPQSSSASRTLNNFTSIAPSSQENSEIITAGSAQSNLFYMVREYKGHIGLFKNNDTVPYEEIQINVDIFPEIDQKLLREGIRANSRQELNRIIEDYEG